MGGGEPERAVLEGIGRIMGAMVTDGFPGEVGIGVWGWGGVELDDTERSHFEVTVWSFEGEADDGVTEGIGVGGLAGGSGVDLELVVQAGLAGELPGVEAEQMVGNGDFVVVLVAGDVPEVVTHEVQQTRVSV